MCGDDRVRRCVECGRDVYDLSAMRADEAVQLIAERGGRHSLRLYRREDGKVLTDDCPLGLRQRRVRRAVIASTVGVMGTAFGAALEPDHHGVRQPAPVVRAEVEARAAADAETTPRDHQPPSPYGRETSN